MNMCIRDVKGLKRLQAETAGRHSLHLPLDTLMEPQVKIDPSPFILAPIEAERKAAILLSSPGFRLHRISA